MKWFPILVCGLVFGQFHRAEQDREIRYWLLDPASHQFRISHDFTITRVGQKHLDEEHEKWDRLTKAVGKILRFG